MAEAPTTSETPAVEAVVETPPAAPASLMGSAEAPAPELEATPAPTVAETLYPEPSAADTADSVTESAAPSDEPSEDASSTEAEPEPPPALTIDSYIDLKVPDTIAVAEPILAAFKDLAVESSLPPDAAQRFVDFFAQAQADISKSQLEAWHSTQAEWTKQIEAMPEFQGERKAQTTAVLGSAIEEFGDLNGDKGNSVREFFNAVGDHPGVVRMIYNMASALVEDGPMLGGKPVGQSGKSKASFAEILYPSSN